ncbi:MAG TPA: hypothetical protein VJ922_03800 [Actinomycetota bacterium]|nr:hypothetical protein [Actinomycetota bacterium]
MLCPECRRQVGKDGYCPSGHLAAPERAAPVEPQFIPRPGVSQPSRFDAPSGPPAPGAPPIPGAPPPLPASEKPARRSAKPRVAIVLLAVLLVGVALAAVLGPSASAANLKYVFASGETHRYSLAMTFDFRAASPGFGGGTFRGSMESILRQTTTAVDDRGVATIQYVIEKMRITEGKLSTNIPPGTTPLTIRMAPDGRVIEARGRSLLKIRESDPVADISGLFGPEAFGPILPDGRVDPGESWEINEEMANPFGDTIRYQGTAQLLKRDTINGQEAAVIKSNTNTPFNFRMSFADLGDFAGTDVPAELRRAVMNFNGYFTTDFTQSLATKSGFLLSALGDLKMTGTLSFENVPDEVKNLSAVFNMTFQVTMTSIS